MPVELEFPIVVARILTTADNAPLDVSDRVIGLDYEDTEGAADKLVLTIDNFDLSNFDDPIWKEGNVVEVSWGYPGHMAPSRQAMIQEIKGFQTLEIECLGPSILMHKSQRNRIFTNMSRALVARQIAEEYGYDAVLQKIHDSPQTYPTITQTRETDAQFLKRLSRLENYTFFVDFDGFHFHPPFVGQKPLRIYHFYTDPTNSDVLSVNLDSGVGGRVGRSRVRGRDPKTKASYDMAGSNKDTARDGTGARLPVTTPGVVFREEVNPETRETKVVTQLAVTDPRADAASGEEVKAPGPGGGDAASAKKEADARYARSVRGTIKLSLVVRGDPSFLAKTVIEIRGIGKRLSGLYYVPTARHRLVPGQYTMELKAKSDGHGGYAEGSATRAGRGEESGAAVNPNAGKQVDPNELEIIEEVNPETRATELKWRDAGGRRLPLVGIKEPAP